MTTVTMTPMPVIDIHKQLLAANSLLDQGLISIQRGFSLEAMENVFAVSCLIEEIRAALDRRNCVDNPSSP